MSKPLALDAAGNLKLSEQHITEQINGLLRARGWECIRTDVIRSRSDRGFIAAGEVGQADWLYLRPTYFGTAECFWAELKRPNAKTNPLRAAKQAEWQAQQVRKGFSCYRAPDGSVDMLEHFQEWYAERFDKEEQA